MWATEWFMKAQIEQLKEENKKLKEFKDKIEGNKFFFKALMELSKPKTVIEAEDLQKAKKIYEEIYMKELRRLEKENKKLKQDLANLQEKYDLVLKLYNKYGTTNR